MKHQLDHHQSERDRSLVVIFSSVTVFLITGIGHTSLAGSMCTKILLCSPLMSHFARIMQVDSNGHRVSKSVLDQHGRVFLIDLSVLVSARAIFLSCKLYCRKVVVKVLGNVFRLIGDEPQEYQERTRETHNCSRASGTKYLRGENKSWP